MKRNRFEILLICMFVFFSCKQNVEGDAERLIELIEIDESYMENLEQFSICFIPLETNDECEIGNITSLISTSKSYIILDAQLSKKIVVFDRNGKYISNIGKIGNGPGEYISPISFSVSPNEDEIAVIDGAKNSIIFYSLVDYSFTREQKIPFYAAYMEYLNNGELIWYNKGKDLSDILIKTDANLNIKKTLLKRDFYSGYTIGSTRKLYKMQDRIYAYTPFSPILHEIYDDSITKVIKFSFGNQEFPPLAFFEQECQKGQENYIPALQKSAYISYFDIFENETHFCIPFFIKGMMFYGFHNKKNNNSYKITQKNMQDLLKVGFFSSPVGVNIEGEFISLLNPDTIRELLEEQSYDLNEELKEIVTKSKEGDNPILLLLKINGRFV